MKFAPVKLFAPLFLVLAVLGASEVPATPRQDFDALANRSLDGYYAFHTTRATRDGIHTHDAELTGYTRDQIQQESERLSAAIQALTAIHPTTLDTARSVDQAILTARAQNELLDLEEIRTWQKDPGWYINLIHDGIQSLASRPFAPEAERLRNIIARERKVGEILASAVENVSAPPRIRTEAAIERTKALTDYLRNGLPAAFSGVTDTTLMGELASANASAIRDLQSFSGYLADLLPGSPVEFKLGLELFEKKLRYSEMIDIPAFRVERYAEQELKRLQLSIKNVSATIDREKTTAQLFRMLSVDCPGTERLLPEVERVTADVRDFCVTRGLTGPSSGIELKAVRAAAGGGPALLRLDAPGAFEKDARRASLHVTFPDPKARSLAVDDFLRTYNRYQLPLLVAAEAWPGAMAVNERNSLVESRVRRAFPFGILTEGWSAYVRGQVIEAGYAGGAKEYELYQLNLDVLDACRCLTAIRMHTGTLTLDGAVTFFETEASLSPADARREARNAALNPGSVNALLGRLQLIKLRDDYRRNSGAAYTPASFHDRILSLGASPPRLLRQMLMPGDKGSIL